MKITESTILNDKIKQSQGIYVDNEDLIKIQKNIGQFVFK